MGKPITALQRDLREFIELCLSRKVEFIVVGAHALAFHGHPRFTGDIDLLLRLNEANAKRIEEVCAEFGFKGPPFTAAQFMQPRQTFQLGRPPSRIDLLTSISGVDTESVFTNGVSGKMGEIEVLFISRDDLMKNKMSTGRAKDLADVEVLKRR